MSAQTPDSNVDAAVSSINPNMSTDQVPDLNTPAPAATEGLTLPDPQVAPSGDPTALDATPPSSQPGNTSSLHPDAWSAHGAVSALVHGAQIMSPVIATALPAGLTKALGIGDPTNSTPQADPTDQAPPGFVLSGKIALFGRDDLQVDFYSHHGPAPQGEILQPGEAPIYQRAELEHELHISELLPAFKNTTFDSIGLKNLTFTYQNMLVDPKKPIGFTIDTDVTFTQDHGHIYEVLTTLLKTTRLDLHLTCSLGIQDWHKPLSVSSFELEGIFTAFKTEPISSGMSITSLGARLTGFHTITYDKDGKLTQGKAYDYSLFGTLTWEPHFPHEMSFEISEAAGNVSLTIALKEQWVHAFGISGLTLDQLSLSTTFDMHNIGSTLEFDLEAIMEIGSTYVSLNGQFSTSGGFTFEAIVKDLGFSGLSDLFEHFYSTTLAKPSINLVIGMATINFSKDAGLSLQIHDLCIETHTASEVDVTISSKGVSLHVVFGDPIQYTIDSQTITLSQATADVTFARSVQAASGTDDGTTAAQPASRVGNTSVMIKGHVVWNGHSLTAGLHLYTSSTTKALEYTVVAQFENLTFGTLVSELQSTFLKDFMIPSAMLVAASQDDAEFGDLDGIPCQIKKGFQVCAVLKGFKPLTFLFGEDAELNLRAGWDGKFAIELLFPTPSTSSKTDVSLHPKPNLNFRKNGVVADQVIIKIVLAPNPCLVVEGGLKIPINHQPEPLHFTMSIALDFEMATLAGALVIPGGWKNPLGISEGLVINELALQVEIVYETFFELGPKQIGFMGSFLIETAPVEVAFVLDEVPSNELLTAKAGNLDLQKIVALTSSLIRRELPKPPNVILFQNIFICACPLGATLNGVTYRPGFAFSATIIIFGIIGSASVSIGKDGFQCSGSVDPFKLGPLQVRGAKGPKACFDISLTEQTHCGSIQGMTTIFDVDTTLIAEFKMHPTLTFDFSFVLHFANIFEFQVKASRTIAASPSNPDATGADYTLWAQFTEDIHSHIEDKLEQMFREKALQEQREASEIQEKLSAHQAEWDDKLKSAQKRLDSALANKNKKIEAREAELNQLVEKHKADAELHRKAIDDRQNALRQSTAARKLALSDAGVKGAKRINNAEQELRNAQKVWDDKLTQAHRKLDDENKILHEKFGDAQGKLSSAQNKVDSLFEQISDINNHIQSCHNAHWYDLAAKAAIPGLEIEKTALEAAKLLADAALGAAKMLVAEAEKVTTGAIKVASKELDDVQKGGDIAINALKSALEVAKADLAKVVSDLQKALDEFTKVEMAAIAGMGKLLAEAQAGLDKATAALNSVAQDLKDCAEFLEVEAAEVALKAAKAGSSALFDIAKAGAAAGMKVEELATSAWQSILSSLEKVVDVTEITISGELGKTVEGSFAFDADVKGTIKGDNFFHVTLKYDHKAVEAFLKSLFEKLVKLIEEGFLQPAEAIVKFAERSPLTVRYGPNGSFSVSHH